MKKLIPLICFLAICLGANAQSSYLSSEGMYTVKKELTNKDFYLVSRYTRFTKKHPASGYYVEMSTDANTSGLSAGYSHKTKIMDASIEFSIGPEFDLGIWDNSNSLGAITTFEFVTKEGDQRAQWKIRLFGSYSHVNGESWHRVYATVAILKWLTIGMLDQTNSVHFAPLVQILLPHGVMQPFVASDGKQTAVGLKFYGKFRMK